MGASAPIILHLITKSGSGPAGYFRKSPGPWLEDSGKRAVQQLKISKKEN
jgi:hypothetical protein